MFKTADDPRLAQFPNRVDYEVGERVKEALRALYEEYPVDTEATRAFSAGALGEYLAVRWREEALKSASNPRRVVYLADSTGIPQDVLVSSILLVVG